jgi:hypothetical protein
MLIIQDLPQKATVGRQDADCWLKALAKNDCKTAITSIAALKIQAESPIEAGRGIWKI